MEIYSPREDSFFFSEFLKEYQKNFNESSKVLDMGAGSGILTKTLLSRFKIENITACDINQKSVDLLKKMGFRAVKSDLFDKINGSFDLIVFNAPYLPEDKREPRDSAVHTSGGKKGDEVSVRFLRQAKKHLNTKGKILLLVSSITPLDKIKKFKPKVLSKKRLFAEELMVLEFEG